MGVRTDPKKFWLFPIIAAEAIFGALVALAGTSAIAPFIYALL